MGRARGSFTAYRIYTCPRGLSNRTAGAMLTMLADAMMPEAFEHGGMLVGIFTVMGFLMAAVLAVME